MYVRVMILFCTRSRRYSTDIPCGKAGLALPIVDPITSECMDIASHSLPWCALEVVGVLENGPGGTFMGPVEMGAREDVLFELPLKEESKFCAEDFRRMVGRSTGPSA